MNVKNLGKKVKIIQKNTDTGKIIKTDIIKYNNEGKIWNRMSTSDLSHKVFILDKNKGFTSISKNNEICTRTDHYNSNGKIVHSINKVFKEVDGIPISTVSIKNYEYDENNRITFFNLVNENNNITISFEYKNHKTPVKITRMNINRNTREIVKYERRHLYDSKGRKIHTLDTLGNNTVYGYEGIHIHKILYGEDKTIVLGWIDGCISYAHNGRYSDKRTIKNGKMVKKYYGMMNEPDSRKEISMTYDDNGNLLSRIDSNTTTIIEYESFKNGIKEKELDRQIKTYTISEKIKDNYIRMVNSILKSGNENIQLFMIKLYNGCITNYIKTKDFDEDRIDTCYFCTDDVAIFSNIDISKDIIEYVNDCEIIGFKYMELDRHINTYNNIYKDNKNEIYHQFNTGCSSVFSSICIGNIPIPNTKLLAITNIQQMPSNKTIDISIVNFKGDKL